MTQLGRLPVHLLCLVAIASACGTVQKLTQFEGYVQPSTIPGKFPASICDDIYSHHQCVTTRGCGWLRTIANGGVCREDPVSHCLTSDECVCNAQDFHGPAYDADLELFLPLSIFWQNLAPRTRSSNRYETRLEMGKITDESLANFTSRTDFTRKKLLVSANTPADLNDLAQAKGMSLALKFMHVWDQDPATISGSLFNGLGLSVVLNDDQLTLVAGGISHAITTDGRLPGKVKDFQCNQLVIVISTNDDAKVYLGSAITVILGLRMDTVHSYLNMAPRPLEVISLGAVNAKVWDVQLYGNDRLLTDMDVRSMGKRCGSAGDYSIPSKYPQSNRRYSWGMGGWKINPDHDNGQSYSSGVYATTWIPFTDTWPPTDDTYLRKLQRMIGFWDRYHEQMLFELDFIPFVDERQLTPQCSTNSYRSYTSSRNPCPGSSCSGEPSNYKNPCRFVTDLFQGFNWLATDFPGEATSAAHRKIGEKGGWTRWSSFDPAQYASWQRPIHEHGHTVHFTIMRTYQKLGHYIRGIAGESFAETMTGYVMPGALAQSWMMQGFTYYPTVPLSFEGRFNRSTRKHVFKNSQPYQEKNIGDQGLGARFYGMQVWWMYVSLYAAKPYMLGRIAADSDLTPGTTLQKLRFFLAQESLDLGELFGNFAAHLATWDWPYLGQHYSKKEQAPFKGISRWCTVNTGASCSIDDLKVQADVSADTGTDGVWIEGPASRKPGGYAFSTIRLKSAPGGALYEFGLEFDVPSELYSGESHSIKIAPHCKDDSRFFSNRIVVADAGSEGQAERIYRPEYYKVPGRRFDSVIIKVPEGRPSNIYLLAVPTPPFDLEDVYPYYKGFSLVWNFRYKVRRLSDLPVGSQLAQPILSTEAQMLSLSKHTGNGFVYDCFHSQSSPTPAPTPRDVPTSTRATLMTVSTTSSTTVMAAPITLTLPTTVSVAVSTSVMSGCGDGLLIAPVSSAESTSLDGSQMPKLSTQSEGSGSGVMNDCLHLQASTTTTMSTRTAVTTTKPTTSMAIVSSTNVVQREPASASVRRHGLFLAFVSSVITWGLGSVHV